MNTKSLSLFSIVQLHLFSLLLSREIYKAVHILPSGG